MYISLSHGNTVPEKGFSKNRKLIDVHGTALSEHSHKKRKDSLETRAVLLMFSLELVISVVAVRSIHQNRKTWQLSRGIA